MMNEYDWAKLSKILRHIFANPWVLALSLLWSLFVLGLVLWLPNIELIRLVFQNESLSGWAKFRFLLEMYQLLFSAVGFIQVFIMLAFTVLSAVGFGLFWSVMAQIHSGEIAHERAKRALLAVVLGGGISMIGITFLTPVITTTGLIFGTNLHLFGTLLSLAGLALTTRAITKLIEMHHLVSLLN